MTIAEAARRNKVSETSVGKWKQQFLEAGKVGLAAGGSARPSGREQALQAEVDELTTALGEAPRAAARVEEVRRAPRGSAGPYPDLVDARDRPVPAGQVGRIVMRPRRSNIWMLGYHGKPELTARAWEGGWLRLDDYGVMDETGWLAFRGRGLDWVRRRGENISAIEVEDACDQHPAVAKSAVVAVPSELTEEEVKLFVQWQEGADRDFEALRNWLAARLAPYKLPAYIQTADEIPRTATGKIAKFRLDRKAAGDWISPTVRPGSAPGEVNS